MPRLLWVVFAVMGAGLLLLMVNHSSGETFGLENNAFARLLYLGLLGAVIAAGVVGARGLGSAVRNIALWLLILLVLVAGYQYRYELQDVASRVTAGLIPGSPISYLAADGTESVVLEKTTGGHFEARASVNGEPVRFVVDTGATATVLTAADAAAAGIDPGSLSYSVPVATANGRARAAQAEVEEISIGSITRNDMTVLVAEPGRLGRSLLGMNFIATLSGFDVRGDRLTLRD
jgi:aspartyl protease family protein